MNCMGVRGVAQAVHLLLKTSKATPTMIRKAPQISTPSASRSPVRRSIRIRETTPGIAPVVHPLRRPRGRPFQPLAPERGLDR